jgi:hypothetical protein
VDGLGEYTRIKTEILDEQFNPLPGYGSDECAAPTLSGLNQPVVWKTRETVQTKGLIRISLSFGGIRPEDARLFAVYVGEAS